MSSSESGNQDEYRRQDMISLPVTNLAEHAIAFARLEELMFNDLPEEEEELVALAHTIEAFEKQVFAI